MHNLQHHKLNECVPLLLVHFALRWRDIQGWVVKLVETILGHANELLCSCVRADELCVFLCWQYQSHKWVHAAMLAPPNGYCKLIFSPQAGSVQPMPAFGPQQSQCRAGPRASV
eukprot:1210907-Amphidinium_carterae.1